MFYFLVKCLHFKQEFLGVQKCSTKRIINSSRNFRHEENQQWICLIIGKAFGAHYSISPCICMAHLYTSLWFSCVDTGIYGFKGVLFSSYCIEVAPIESIDCVTYTEPIYSDHQPIYFSIYCHNIIQ